MEIYIRVRHRPAVHGRVILPEKKFGDRNGVLWDICTDATCEASCRMGEKL